MYQGDSSFILTHTKNIQHISKATKVVLKKVRRESSESVGYLLNLVNKVNKTPGCFVFSMPFFWKAFRTFEHNQKRINTLQVSHWYVNANMAYCLWRTLDVFDAFELNIEPVCEHLILAFTSRWIWIFHYPRKRQMSVYTIPSALLFVYTIIETEMYCNIRCVFMPQCNIQI